jgi:uncharacterized protein YcbX
MSDPGSDGGTRTVGRVARIHLHPVKSCRRIEVPAATVGPLGLDGDRRWAVVTDDDRLVTQRERPQLATVTAEPVPDGLRLSAPDRPTIEVPEPPRADRSMPTWPGFEDRMAVGDAGDEAAHWFRSVLDLPCRLVAITDAGDRRPPAGLDPFGQPVALTDLAPLLVANRASYRFLLERAVEPFGIARFRSNLVVAGPPAWSEDTWRDLQVGAAEVRAVMPWPRCPIPQVDQATGQRGREPARVLKAHRWCTELDGAPALRDHVRDFLVGHTIFGIACSIGPVGARVAVGDPVVVRSWGPPLMAPPTADPATDRA